MHLLTSPRGSAAERLVVAGREKQTEEGADLANCGWSDLPCRSITSALQYADPGYTVSLTDGDDDTTDISSSIASKLTATGSTRDGTKVDLTGDAFTVTSAGSGEISTMTVSVQSGSFVSSQSTGTFTLSSIKLEGVENMNDLDQPLTEATSGTLILNAVVLKNLKMGSRAAVKANGVSSFEMKGSSKLEEISHTNKATSSRRDHD